VDGVWFSAPISDFYYSDNVVPEWWSVDLGGEFAVKRVMIGNAQVVGKSHRSRDVRVWIGRRAPRDNPISNVDDFAQCARWPFRSVHGEIFGVTCDCLVLGRHVAVVNGFPTVLQLTEVGVYGVRKEDLQ